MHHFVWGVLTEPRLLAHGLTPKRRQILGLNVYGEIVQQQWEWLEKQYEQVKLDVFIVMPNHIHGILIIPDCVGNGRDRSLQVKSLSSLMGVFKTTSSKLIHQNNLQEFKWQKSFYDHIIRNDESLNKIREYVVNNPCTWHEDEENINRENF